MPCLVKLSLISFLSGTTHFAISFDIVDSFLAGNGQPQTNSPNGQASG